MLTDVVFYLDGTFTDTLAVAAAWSDHADGEAVRRSDPDEHFDSSLGFASWLTEQTTPG